MTPDAPWALLLAPVRPDAGGNGLARRAWLWARELSAHHRLVTLVVSPDPAAGEGRTELPGRLVVLPATASPSRRQGPGAGSCPARPWAPPCAHRFRRSRPRGW